MELPALDGVIAHDAVDGKQIEQNVKLVTKLIMSKTSSQQKKQACSNGKYITSSSQPHLLPFNSPHYVLCPTDAVTDVPNWVILAMRCLSKCEFLTSYVHVPDCLGAV